MAQQQKVGKPTDKKQDEWQQDLNPNPKAGQNYSIGGSGEALNAFDIKELHEKLEGFSSDELKQIIVLPPGTRLEQGAKYVDLNDPERKEFTAMGNMEAGTDNMYVLKTEVGYQIWNKLIGVQNPERTGEGNQS